MRRKLSNHGNTQDWPKNLFVCDEIAPFLANSYVGIVAEKIASTLANFNTNLRTFTPKWGGIKEKRYQLHDVLRISGLNIIFNDMDHLLFTKATTLMRSRTQVYFIGDKDYFARPGTFYDPSSGRLFKDTHERIIFFLKGVIKCVEKIQWAVDCLHVCGPFSFFFPIYIKKLKDSLPHFTRSTIITHLCELDFVGEVSLEIFALFKSEGITEKFTEFLPLNSENIIKMSIKYSDFVVIHSESMQEKFLPYIQNLGIEYIILPPIDSPNYQLQLLYALEKMNCMKLPDEYHPEKMLSESVHE